MTVSATRIGYIRRVRGATVTVELSRELPSTSPIVEGRVHRIGQIGSFVRIPLGFVNVYGVVSMVGAQPNDLNDVDGEPEVAQAIHRRILEVQLVGEAVGNEPFQRGLSSYPTIDDEVHVVTRDDLERIYPQGATAQLVIGRLAASESLRATVDVGRLVTRHAAIVGSTGSGKSNTVASLLRAITSGLLPSAQVVVVDPHGEYAAALAGKAKVFAIGDTTNPLLIPVWALSFDELAHFLVERKTASETPQDGLLRDRIAELRRKGIATAAANKPGNAATAEELTADSPVPFSIRELWYAFDRLERATYTDMARTQEALEQEGNPETLTSARFKAPGAGSSPPHKAAPPPIMGPYVTKILSRLRDRRFDFFLSPGEYNGSTKDLDSLMSSWLGHEYSITVLDLAGVPADVMDVVVGFISRILFEVAFWGRKTPGTGRNRPLLMVFEEAHSYLPAGDSRFIQGYARRAVQRILREGRKYGVGAVVVSQRPSDLDETILSQCGTFFALRLTNTADQARVRATLPDEIGGLVELLSSLRTGEAIVLGDALQIPSRVRVGLAEPRPDSQDPNVPERWKTARVAADYAAAVTAWRRQRIG